VKLKNKKSSANLMNKLAELIVFILYLCVLW